jgi:ATP phosphoribosyltransferase
MTSSLPSPKPSPGTLSTPGKLILALPSKGRMMEDAAAVFARAGLPLTKSQSARGYQGEMAGQPDVEVQYVSASDIAGRLRAGTVHLGVTGEDLVQEASTSDDERVVSLKALGFGQADVVTAVPTAWLDVHRLADLETVGLAYRRRHGRRLRVATKYMNLARRAFAKGGLASYRLVESFGATEGAPAAGLAELIVDITSTGATLKANGLRVLDDGILLRSEAHVFMATTAAWPPHLAALRAQLAKRLG